MLKDRIIDRLIDSNFQVNENGWPCLKFGPRLIILNDVDSKTSLRDVNIKFRKHIDKITEKWEVKED